MGRLAGLESYAISIGTTVPAEATETALTLAGDYIKLLAPKATYGPNQMQTLSATAGGYTYANKTGKRQYNVQFTAWIVFDAAGDLGGDFGFLTINDIDEFLMEAHESAETPLFLVMKRTSGADVNLKSFYERETKRWYLKGYCPQWRFIDQGPAVPQIQLTFVEAWN